MSARAAFFDLDRTLVRVNTGTRYVRWRVRRGEMGAAEVVKTAWWTALYTLGLLEAHAVGAVAARTLEGVDEAVFRDECRAWVREEILEHVSAAAQDELARRESTGWTCALLTSASPYVAEPLAERFGIEHVLCTELEVEGGHFTGRLATPMCYGAQKVERARLWAAERGVRLEDCAFFTDSVSELPMLETVGEPRVINPDPRLRLLAWRRDWPIDLW